MWNQEEGAFSLEKTNAPWRVPRDLVAYITGETRAQVGRMVGGASLRVQARRLDAPVAASASVEVVAEADAPSSSLSSSTAGRGGWRGWLVSRTSLPSGSTSKMNQRFVQMSTDLTTLRWSWSDYILLHEIERIEHERADLSMRVLHGPRDALKVLELHFDDEPTWQTWHEGLKALHAVLADSGEPRKLEWLLQIFRLADTANLGSVTTTQLRELMNYLNYELPERFHHLGDDGRVKQRRSLSSQLGALLAPAPKTAVKTYNFREFQRLVQQQALMPAAEALLRLAPAPQNLPLSVLNLSIGGAGRKPSAGLASFKEVRASLKRRFSSAERIKREGSQSGASPRPRSGVGSQSSGLGTPITPRGGADASSSSDDGPPCATASASQAELLSSSHSVDEKLQSICSSGHQVAAATLTSSQGPGASAGAPHGGGRPHPRGSEAPPQPVPAVRLASDETKRREELGGGISAKFSMRLTSFGGKRRLARQSAGKKPNDAMHGTQATLCENSEFVRGRGSPRVHGGPPPNVDRLRKLWQHEKLQGPAEELSEGLIRLFREVVAKGALGSRWLNAHGLQRLLLSEENELFDPARIGVDLSTMGQPITDYFVASSHNSYLTGDQFRSNSDCRMYEQQLLMGCRCLEIDCWDGADGEPTVYHGMTFTSKIKFRDVIISIERFAFVSSAYPVILSLEMHCSLPQQEKIAHYLRHYLGSKLHLPNDETFPFRNVDVLPSPRQLLYKVLVKGRTLDDEQLDLGAALDDDQLSDDDKEPDWGARCRDSARDEPPESRRGSLLSPARAADPASTPLLSQSMPEAALPATPGGWQPLSLQLPVGTQSPGGTRKEEVAQSSRSDATESRRSTINSLSPGPSKWSAVAATALHRAGTQLTGAGTTSTPAATARKDGKKQRPTKLGANFATAAVLELELSRNTKVGGKEGGKEGGKGEKAKKPVQQDLSDVTAISGRKYRRFAAQGEGTCWQMSSFGETKGQKLLERLPGEWAVHNTQQFSRTYPKGSRIDSSNYDSCLAFWNVGVQMVALNYQTNDLFMQLERAKFADNGGCGYVLKPDYLRRGPGDDAPPPTPALSVPPQLHVLRVEVLGALHVPTPGEARGDADGFHFAWWPTGLQPAAAVCDPFVSVEAFGGAFAGAAARREEVQHRQAWCTTAAARNGLNPSWDGEAAEVVLSHPELSQLYLALCHKQKGKTRQLGYGALPVAAVRGGVRCVSLLDEHGAPLLFCKLLVRVSFDTVHTGKVAAAYYHATSAPNASGKGPAVVPREAREPAKHGNGGPGGRGAADERPSSRVPRMSVFAHGPRRASGPRSRESDRGSVAASARSDGAYFSTRGSVQPTSSRPSSRMPSARGSVQPSALGSVPTGTLGAVPAGTAAPSVPSPPGPPPPLPPVAGVGASEAWRGEDDVISVRRVEGGELEPPRPLATLELGFIQEEDSRTLETYRTLDESSRRTGAAISRRATVPPTPRVAVATPSPQARPPPPAPELHLNHRCSTTFATTPPDHHHHHVGDNSSAPSTLSLPQHSSCSSCAQEAGHAHGVAAPPRFSDPPPASAEAPSLRSPSSGPCAYWEQ